jgi:hypothetical protein
VLKKEWKVGIIKTTTKRETFLIFLQNFLKSKGSVRDVRALANKYQIGEGIPLFAPQDFEIKTKLLSVEKSESEIITLRYEILK